MKEGVAILFATPEAAYGHDVHYRYRPDPDLFYLTGFTEPEAAAVLDADHRTLTLFVRPKDRAKETWEGRRSGPEGAVRDYGADARTRSENFRNGSPTSSGAPTCFTTRSAPTRRPTGSSRLSSRDSDARPGTRSAGP